MKCVSRGNPVCREVGASAIPLLLVGLLCAILGAGLTWVFSRPKSPPPPPPSASSLSERTRNVLQALEDPVEIRFYALLDPSTASPELKAFADRAEQLVHAYAIEAPEKVRLQMQTSTSNPEAARDAAHDGLQPFNLEAGEASFLGIVVSTEGRREVLPLLSADWETALEADLSRAMARLTAKAPALPKSNVDPALKAAAVEQVQKQIANTADVSLDDGRNRLRQAAVAELRIVAAETEQLLRRAQEKLARAQASGAELEQETALRELQQIQQAQMQKVKEIASRSEAQVEAWENLKRGD